MAPVNMMGHGSDWLEGLGDKIDRLVASLERAALQLQHCTGDVCFGLRSQPRKPRNDLRKCNVISVHDFPGGAFFWRFRTCVQSCKTFK